MNFKELINREVVPATGCTEPIAIALASAKAAKALGNIPDKIDIYLSGNMLKNSMGVGIPGTGMTGIYIAAAMGVIGGNPDLELEVLKDITESQIQESKEFVEENRIQVSKKDVPEKLYIEIICQKEKETSKVIIKNTHTNVCLIELNGITLYKGTTQCSEANQTEENDPDEKIRLSVREIYEYAVNSSFDEIKFILDGAYMNYEVAKVGLSGEYGLKVGKTIKKNVEKGFLRDDFSTYAMSMTAAASDARMAGYPMSVMSNSGSGNQGITVMLPIYALAKRKNINEEKLARALIIGNLIAIHVKSYLGRLSALCGAVAAAAGASGGITFLLGGNYSHIVYTLKNMVGNISGMICDGAKPGCALKVSTAVSAAIQSALLAIDGIEISENDGIIERDIEKTLINLAKIGSEGMGETDRMILDIMSCK
jgi:L-cysteine desulfidase